MGKNFQKYSRKETKNEAYSRRPTLFFRRAKNVLQGLCVTYVDNTLQAGSNIFSEISKETEKEFNFKAREWENTKLSRLQTETKNEFILIHQKNYIQKLQNVLPNDSFYTFRSLRAKLSFCTNSRPDIACFVAVLTQIREDRFCKTRQILIRDLRTLLFI